MKIQLEQLEDRCVPAATAGIDLNGNLVVNGWNDRPNNIIVNNTFVNNIAVVVNGSYLGSFSITPANRVIVFGGPKNDLIQTPGYSTVEIHGNDGNDRIYGSSRRCFLFGDNGDDLLVVPGGSKSNVVVGGLGRDTIQGGSGGDNLLIGGDVQGPLASYDNLKAFDDAFALDPDADLSALTAACYDPEDAANLDQISSSGDPNAYFVRNNDLLTNFRSGTDKFNLVTNP